MTFMIFMDFGDPVLDEFSMKIEVFAPESSLGDSEWSQLIRKSSHSVGEPIAGHTEPF